MRNSLDNQHGSITAAFTEIMEFLDLDLSNDSLKKTPSRVAKMYIEEIFWGLNYDNFPEVSVFQNSMKVDEMILETSSVMSTCEHHFVPFVGKAYTAYIPNTRLLGLSKFNRVVDFFSRRPQVQERLTEQIAATLQLALGTENVAVVIKAEHMCVKLRGVKDQNSITVTSKMSGHFRKPEVRAEFFALVNAHT